MFIPTLQDIVAGAVVARAARRGGRGVGRRRPRRADGRARCSRPRVYGATSTGTTFVLGGVVAAGLVVYELRRDAFGADDHGALAHPAAPRALVASPPD